MARQSINYGTVPNDGTGDTLRASQQKAEANFIELYAAIGGTTPHNAIINYSGATITVPTGFSGIITNLNDTYSTVAFAVVGTVLTITSGAANGEILLINGRY